MCISSYAGLTVRNGMWHQAVEGTRGTDKSTERVAFRVGALNFSTFLTYIRPSWYTETSIPSDRNSVDNFEQRLHFIWELDLQTEPAYLGRSAPRRSSYSFSFIVMIKNCSDLLQKYNLWIPTKLSESESAIFVLKNVHVAFSKDVTLNNLDCRIKEPNICPKFWALLSLNRRREKNCSKKVRNNSSRSPACVI